MHEKNSVEAANHHLGTIRVTYASAAPLVQQSLAGALESVERDFSRRGHYLYEFLQNADDAGATQMKARLQAGIMEILNNGNPFSAQDVEALCKIGRSAKKPAEYIGFLGVGFKSVFLASNGPEIHSGPYHFAFRADPGGKDAPWQIMPVAIPPEPIPNSWQTRFRIPLKGDDVVETVRKEMGAESLNRRVLLFLPKVARLELRDEDRHLAREIIRREREKKHLGEGDASETIYELEEDGAEPARERWLVIDRCFPVPNEVRADPRTRAWNRENVETRRVVLAFKLSNDGGLEAVTGTVHMGAFSFLPLREEPTGLKFVIQGDFLTSTSRETIMRDARWNTWVAGALLDLLKEETGRLLAHPQRAARALEVLWPGSPPFGDSFFSTTLKQGLWEFLTREVHLPAYDGTSVLPAEALYVSQEDDSVHGLVDPEELQELYGKKPLRDDLVIPYTVLSGQHAMPVKEVTLVGAKNAPGLLRSSEGSRLLKAKAEKGDVDFFLQLVKALRGVRYAPETIQRYIGDAPIVLSERGELRALREVCFRPADLPPSLERCFTFVHPALSVGNARQRLEALGVPELSDWKRREQGAKLRLAEIRDQWERAADRQALLAEVKGPWQERMVSANELAFLTVPTKGGAWRAPEDAFFPSEFSPEPDVEALVQSGLLEQMEFVDPSLMEGGMKGWKEFLTELGVGRRGADAKTHQSWSQRIGIRVALSYEENQGRDVDPTQGLGEVLESQRGQGYDIQSREPDGGSRFIEVKGLAKEGPFQIRASTLRQFFFGNQKDRFYLYVVTDTLKENPRLHILWAARLDRERLLKISDITVSLKDLADAVEDTLSWKQLQRLVPRA